MMQAPDDEIAKNHAKRNDNRNWKKIKFISKNTTFQLSIKE